MPDIKRLPMMVPYYAHRSAPDLLDKVQNRDHDSCKTKNTAQKNHDPDLPICSGGSLNKNGTNTATFGKLLYMKDRHSQLDALEQAPWFGYKEQRWVKKKPDAFILKPQVTLENIKIFLTRYFGSLKAGFSHLDFISRGGDVCFSVPGLIKKGEVQEPKIGLLEFQFLLWKFMNTKKAEAINRNVESQYRLSNVPQWVFDQVIQQIFLIIDRKKAGEITFQELAETLDEVFWNDRVFTIRRRQEKAENMVAPTPHYNQKLNAVLVKAGKIKPNLVERDLRPSDLPEEADEEPEEDDDDENIFDRQKTFLPAIVTKEGRSASKELIGGNDFATRGSFNGSASTISEGIKGLKKDNNLTDTDGASIGGGGKAIKSKSSKDTPADQRVLRPSSKLKEGKDGTGPKGDLTDSASLTEINAAAISSTGMSASLNAMHQSPAKYDVRIHSKEEMTPANPAGGITPANGKNSTWKKEISNSAKKKELGKYLVETTTKICEEHNAYIQGEGGYEHLNLTKASESVSRAPPGTRTTIKSTNPTDVCNNKVKIEAETKNVARIYSTYNINRDNSNISIPFPSVQNDTIDISMEMLKSAKIGDTPSKTQTGDYDIYYYTTAIRDFALFLLARYESLHEVCEKFISGFNKRNDGAEKNPLSGSSPSKEVSSQIVNMARRNSNAGQRLSIFDTHMLAEDEIDEFEDVNYEEWRLMLQNVKDVKVKPFLNNAKEIFDYMDTDNDGKINAYDLVRLFRPIKHTRRGADHKENDDVEKLKSPIIKRDVLGDNKLMGAGVAYLPGAGGSHGVYYPGSHVYGTKYPHGNTRQSKYNDGCAHGNSSHSSTDKHSKSGTNKSNSSSPSKKNGTHGASPSKGGGKFASAPHLLGKTFALVTDEDQKHEKKHYFKEKMTGGFVDHKWRRGKIRRPEKFLPRHVLHRNQDASLDVPLGTFTRTPIRRLDLEFHSTEVPGTDPQNYVRDLGPATYSITRYPSNLLVYQNVHKDLNYNTCGKVAYH